MDVFAFFKLYKRYQIAQRNTYRICSKIDIRVKNQNYMPYPNTFIHKTNDQNLGLAKNTAPLLLLL